MGNPLLVLLTRPFGRRPRVHTPRRPVPVPTEVPSTDAIFLVMRRMRLPFICLVLIFAVSVAGLALIPGRDPAGNTVRMTVFDAFYFMSFTATTIGFGELPRAFTTAQRMWVTASIYASVIGWAYAIGSMFALLQDQGFREAVLIQQLRRKVRRIDEPFLIVAGYGEAGRRVCKALDDARRRFVVVDHSRANIESLEAHQLAVEAPALEGDASSPAVLGLVGLGHRHCEGVLALTDDDDDNLAIVMTVTLLRPDLPVIARCHDRVVAERMRAFDPAAVINPIDRYGGYLTLALQRPVTYQLLTWLMSLTGTRLPAARAGLVSGTWVVCADGQFGIEVARDLRAAGLEVIMADPRDGDPDVSAAVGLVAGTDRDATNLALAERARLSNPDLFLSVRQQTHSNAALVEALDIDSVHVSTELVARETLARVVTPVYWRVIEHAVEQDDAWSSALLELLVERCGERIPDRELVRLDAVQAPAVVRWLGDHELTLGDLLSHPDDRTRPLPAVALLLVRDDDTVFTPSPDELLHPGDQVLLVERRDARAALSRTLFYDASVEYVATGREVPSTWLWRRLARRAPAQVG
jgi:Trk K+ transport system NAD-binding subunit